MGDVIDISVKQRRLIAEKIKDKPFDEGMYSFIMFMIDYYTQVKRQLKVDYDSFIIIQIVTSHSIYILNKSSYVDKISYPDIKGKWEKMISEFTPNTEHTSDDKIDIFKKTYNVTKSKGPKLTISSICLVSGLPKETVRRKVINLVKKKILSISSKHGVKIGESYKKVYNDFVPITTFEVIKLLKKWEKIGLLKTLLELKV